MKLHCPGLSLVESLSLLMMVISSCPRMCSLLLVLSPLFAFKKSLAPSSNQHQQGLPWPFFLFWLNKPISPASLHRSHAPAMTSLVALYVICQYLKMAPQMDMTVHMCSPGCQKKWKLTFLVTNAAKSTSGFHCCKITLAAHAQIIIQQDLRLFSAELLPRLLTLSLC